MNIIGHRGAAGLALENTLDSFKLAIQSKVYAIEFDVRKTADNQLVVFHDSDLKRLANRSEKISDLTLSELNKIKLIDGKSHIPSLVEVLNLVKNYKLLIEIKDENTADLLIQVLDKFPKIDYAVLSFLLDEMTMLREARPEIKIYLNEHTKYMEVIQIAKARKLNGVGLNYWLLNPFSYWLARRAKLDLFVFTIDNKVIAKMIGMLYPKVGICTNHPEYFNNSKKYKST